MKHRFIMASAVLALAGGTFITSIPTSASSDTDSSKESSIDSTIKYNIIRITYINNMNEPVENNKAPTSISIPQSTFGTLSNDYLKLDNYDTFTVKSDSDQIYIDPVDNGYNISATSSGEITVIYKNIHNRQTLIARDFIMNLPEEKVKSQSSTAIRATNNLKPTVKDFQATATDRQGNELEVQIDDSDVNYYKAGKYKIKLFTIDGQSKTVYLTIKRKPPVKNKPIIPAKPDNKSKPKKSETKTPTTPRSKKDSKPVVVSQSPAIILNDDDVNDNTDQDSTNSDLDSSIKTTNKPDQYIDPYVGSVKQKTFHDEDKTQPKQQPATTVKHHTPLVSIIGIFVSLSIIFGVGGYLLKHPELTYKKRH